MSKITLDAETFKALASSTRLAVLKELDERRKTLTELARDLALNKATVHEHLGLLLAADLVRKRDDEGHKWIYYELTWTGQRILRPEATTTFNVLLGLSALAGGGGVLMAGRALDWWLDAGRSEGPDPGVMNDGAENKSLGAPEQGASDSGASSSSGTETSSQQQAAGAPAEEFPQVETIQDAGKSGDGDRFLDDGGWVAIALVAAFVVFCALALFLYWRLTPKPFNPEAAAAAEAELSAS